MPVPKPKTGEAEDKFIERCMTEVSQGVDRPNEQNVAICMGAWRAAHGGKPPKKDNGVDAPEPEDGESHGDFLERCTEEVLNSNEDVDDEQAEEACQSAWEDRQFMTPSGVTQFRTHAEDVQEMNFVMSDENVDRMGETISSEGWDLKNFKKNPIALFGHRSDFVIGRWRDIHIEDRRLKGRLEFAPAGTSARIDEVRRLVDAGILKAVSVGFRAMSKEPIDEKADKYFGPFKYLAQELVECSLVAVPANPNALAVAKSLRISPATIDLVFAGHGNRDGVVRRGATGGHANALVVRKGKGQTMSLAQRIVALQTQIVAKQDELNAILDRIGDGVADSDDLEASNRLNDEIAQLDSTRAMYVESERHLGASSDDGGDDGHAATRSRALSTTVLSKVGNGGNGGGAPLVPTSRKRDLDLVDYIVRGGTAYYVAKVWGRPVEETRLKVYGNDEPTRLMTEMVTRAASAPALTTVAGWAQELVQQTYTDLMPLLMPDAILTRLSAKGLALSFGRAGKIVIPTRSRTPTLAGSFVGEGQAIPVRQGAFTSQTIVPKKLAVISTWTREMDEHSIPAIEGILREAIQQDTSVAVDTVLIDANAATTTRPAGLLNGVAAQTATSGGGITAIVGDLKLLIGALTTNTYGNVRAPVFLANPSDLLSVALATAANTGIFPFAAGIANKTLNGIPIIDSTTVPAKTVILVDAADFVVVGGGAPRFELSDQATLHLEDSSPLDLATGSPATVASPQRSLFQTDSIALRMVLPLNWVQRRSGTIAWVQNVTW